MLLPDDRCPAEYRRADRNGFCPTALEDWIAAAERARVGIHRRKGSDRYNFAKFRDAPGHACAVIVQEGGNVISVSVLIVGTSPVPHVHPSPRRRRRRGDPQTKRGCMHQPEP